MKREVSCQPDNGITGAQGAEIKKVGLDEKGMSGGMSGNLQNSETYFRFLT